MVHIFYFSIDIYHIWYILIIEREIENMTNTELVAQINSLNEWEQLLKEATEMTDSIKDTIKEEMNARGTEELEAGGYIVRYTSVLTSRFNTKAFKEDYGEIYKHYTKQVASRRFSISC